MAELENDPRRMDKVNTYDTNYSVRQCKDYFGERIAKLCKEDEADMVMGGLESALYTAFLDGSILGDRETTTKVMSDTRVVLSGINDKVYHFSSLVEAIDAEPIYRWLVGNEIVLMLQRMHILGYGYGMYHAVKRAVDGLAGQH